MAYKWTNPPAGIAAARTYDGLNRDASIATTTGGYDSRGNLTGDGTRTFTYDVENRLISVGVTATGATTMTLSYDPAGRLRQTVPSSSTTQFLYDGDRLSAEYTTSGTVKRRYVHGPGVDEPLLWYEGADTANPRWLHHDAQGSVIAWSGDTGNVNASRVYRYGPWGEPDDNWAAGASRFRYTGQIALNEVGLYHYKARVYDPAMGRFLQTDPIGGEDDVNLYAYVGGDPVSKTDPTGNSCAQKIVFSITSISCQNGWPQLGANGKSNSKEAKDSIYRKAPESRSRPILEAATRDSGVRRKMAQAWNFSNGSSRDNSTKHEHGFWIYRRQDGTFRTGPIIVGYQNSIPNAPPPSIQRGDVSAIWFHTHPFINWETRPSGSDVQFLRSMRADGIVASHRGMYYYGY